MIAVSAACLAAAPAARAEPVTIETEDLLGGRCNSSWGTLRVTLTNRWSHPVSGTLRTVESTSYRHRLTRSVEIPAQGTTSLLIHAPPEWCDIRFRLETDREGRYVARAGSLWPADRGDQIAQVFVVQDQLELRPALSLVEASGYQPERYSSPPGPPPGVAQARIHGSPARPDLPEYAAAYHHFRLVLAEARLLQRLNEAQRNALTRWIRTGGKLVVVAGARSEILDSEILDVLAPDLEAGSGPTTVVFSPGLTELFQVGVESRDSGRGAGALLQFNAPRLQAENYGSSLQVGLGSVHFLLTTSRAETSNTPEATSAARAALDQLLTWDQRNPLTAWDNQEPDAAARGELRGRYGNNIGQVDEWSAARTLAIDANLDERLPLSIYIIVVLLCTAALFLVQRRWSRGGRAVARLLAPAGAVTVAGCVLVFGLSYAVRGVGHRYRSMAFIEAGSGMNEGAMWRRLALAFDGPGTERVPRAPRLLATARRSETVTDADGREALLVTGGRWETVLAAEHGVVDLGGAIHIEWNDASRPAAVRNGLETPVTNAGVLFRDHSYYLGRIEPGQRVELPPEVGAHWSVPGHYRSVSDWHRVNEYPVTATFIGEIDRGCPDRGEFRGDRCHTALVVWGTP